MAKADKPTKTKKADKKSKKGREASDSLLLESREDGVFHGVWSCPVLVDT